MPSPFPGMDPYLEQPGVWPDFHATFLTTLRLDLAARLGPGYVALVEVSLSVQAAPPAPRRVRVGVADLAVAGRAGPAGAAVAGASPSVRAVLPQPGVSRRQRWVAVRDAASREIVTVLELLSPANKAGSGAGKYLQKRERVLGSRANLVEVDLLRGGARPPAGGVAATDYRVVVSRPAGRPGAEAWAVGLRDRLPAVPVPLRPADPAVVLDLQAAFDRAYDGAGYRRFIHETPPDPPLSAADAAWAAGLLAPLPEGR